ncbi:hypothetical protein [Sphingomonas radiodurans]|uniref:hypothetical protein n=1 Tax=Sphingomonas radiodurans TaxID=2890321 RepID=UPI001E5851F1|nr:hypothetical protein [Sphingomonas radiodurans]WBH16813.1 hypothetical protein LLW23_01440 [Sphingomonas radiodurans]
MLGPKTDVEDFVLQLDLPDTGPQFEAVEPERVTGDLIAVGSQLAEFTGTVDPESRLAVSDAMLLAQLAADKASTPDEAVFTWYDRYVATLRSIGFSVIDKEEATQDIDDDNLSLHEAAIPVIAAALGPAVAAASLVIKALDGLKSMNADQPWITLFERNSRHVHGAAFQVSRIEGDANGNPHVTLLCFAVTAQRTITQVLFLKFSDDDVSLRQSKHILTCNRASLPVEAIAGRVKPFLADNVAALEL